MNQSDDPRSKQDLEPSATPSTQEATEESMRRTEGHGIWLMGFLLLSRFLAIFRDTVLSSKFGVFHQGDAYRLAFTIPDILYYGVAGGAFSSAFIPVFTHFITQGKEEEAWNLFNVILTAVTIFVLIFVAIAFLFAHSIAAYIGAGKPPFVIEWSTTMGRILLPAQLAFFVGGILFGVLYTFKNVKVPGLGPVIYNLGIIFGGIALSSFFHPGIAGMTVGALIGAYLGNIVVPFIFLHRMGVRYKPSLNLRAPGVKQVVKLMLPVVFGLSLPGVYAIIMQKFASQDGTGMNISIELANRVMQAPLGIFGQSLALATFPVLAAFVAEKKYEGFSTQLQKTLKTVVFLSVPAAALMFFIPQEIVHAVYGYGKSREAGSLHHVVVCLRFFAIGVPAWCLHPLLMRAFFSLQNSFKPILTGTITTAAFIFMIIILRNFGLGYKAMPIAGSIAPIGLVIALLILLKRDVKVLIVSPVVVTLLKCVIAATVAGFLSLVPFLLPHEHLSKLLSLGLLFFDFLFMAWVYFLLAKILKVEETETVNRGLNRFHSKFSRSH